MDQVDRYLVPATRARVVWWDGTTRFDPAKEVSKSGWYKLGKASDGQYHFVLKAANSETILSSERYTTPDAAKTGIVSVQQNSADASRYEKKQSSDGKPYFTLKAANHQVIGTSQMYSSESARDAGIASVQTSGPTGTVKETT